MSHDNRAFSEVILKSDWQPCLFCFHHFYATKYFMISGVLAGLGFLRPSSHCDSGEGLGMRLEKKKIDRAFLGVGRGKGVNCYSRIYTLKPPSTLEKSK